MKKLSIISLFAAAVVFGFASCSEEAEEFKKGTPDVDACYGVYFPAQITSLSLDPAEPTVDTIYVARTKTEGAIEVPFKLTGADSVFVAQPLTFADGQKESYIALSFDKAEVGVKYTCSILIDDPKYASQYTSNAIGIDIDVTRDKWNDLGMATFNDWYMLGDTYKVQLLQNDKNKSLFRLMHPYDAGAAAGEYGSNIGELCEYIPLELVSTGSTLGGVKISEEDLVYFNISSTGYHHSSYDADILIVHPANFSSLRDEANYMFSKVIQYQDDNDLPAGIQLAPYYYMNGVGGWPFYDSDPVEGDHGIRIVFPGAVLTDYSLSIEGDFAQMGVAPVTFTLGADVASVVFASYEGELNASAIEDKLESLLAGKETTDTIVKSGVYGLSFDKTGVYTILAVAFDAEGAKQTVETATINFVAAGDAVPVDVEAELISTKKYERMGYSSDNTLEFTVYGSDLESAYIGLFNSRSFNSDPKGAIEWLIDPENENDVDDETLAAINSTGYTDVFTGLDSGTEYTLLVVADNGFEQKAIVATATTTGDPIPVYMSYSMADLDPTLQPAEASGYNGSYDYFAVDGFGESGVREFMSTVTLEAIDDSTIVAKNMFAAEAKKYGFNDDFEFAFEEGYLVSLGNVFAANEGGYYAAAYHTDGNSVYSYGYDELFIGGFVSEGHIAIVDYETGVDLTGWLLGAFGDETFSKRLAWIGMYLNPMFVTPGLYDDLKAPARKAELNQLSSALNAPRTNFVETQEGYIKSTIRNFKNAKRFATCGTMAGLDIESAPRAAAVKVEYIGAKQQSERSYENPESINF